MLLRDDVLVPNWLKLQVAKLTVTREALDSYLTSQGARRGVPPVQGRGRGPAAAGA